MIASQLLRALRPAHFYLVCALLWLNGGHAQETALQSYDVELVIFRLSNPTNTAEDWSLEEARAAATLPQSAETEEPATPNEPVTVTEGSESSIQPTVGGPLKLAAIENSLRRNRAYVPLAHVAWTQPGFAINNPRPLAMESLLPPNTGITGKVSLVRGRYLHLTLELTLIAPDGKRYVLREQRRMRSGDKHYFDHPYFGAIALVTPKGSEGTR